MHHTLSESETPAIAYERIGSGSPILFIHGLTYDRHMWQPVIRRLTNDYTCIAIDLPGHGNSRDAQTYDLATVTRNIHNAVTLLGVEKPIIVGHSMGGLIALAYASMFPAAGLVTSDWTLPDTAFLQRLHDMREHSRRPALIALWRSTVRQLGVGLIHQSQRAFVESAPNPGQDVVLGYWREVLETSPAELQARLLDYTNSVDAPFTAIFGDDVGPDYLSVLRTVAPQCNIICLPHCGQFSHLVEIDRFVAEVRAIADKPRKRCTLQKRAHDGSAEVTEKNLNGTR